MKEFCPNNVEDTESIGLENGEDSPTCGSRSLSDPGDGGLADLVHIGVDYEDRDAEDGIGSGLGVLKSPEMVILPAALGDERLVSPHQLWLAQKSPWKGEIEYRAFHVATNEVECDSDKGYDYLDSTSSADGIVAEDWDEVANTLNL